MGMVVRSNLMAVNAQRQLGMNTSQVAKALEKLSSGYRINRAGDDASGLAISEKMKAQIRGLDAASLNSQDGISVVQTAEGALTEVHNMLNRMTELATRAANGINNEQNRQSLQDEVTELQAEIDRISQATNFNGINLLDGSMGGGGSAKAPEVVANVKAGQPTVGKEDAKNSSFTVNAKIADGSGDTFEITYNDASGAEHKVTITGVSGTNTQDELIKKINEHADLKGLFSASLDGDKLKIEALDGKGEKVEVTAIKSGNGGTAGTDVTGKKTAASPEKTTVTLGAQGAMAAGDTITVNGKTYTMAQATNADKNEFKDIAGLKELLEKDGVTLEGTDLNANSELKFSTKTDPNAKAEGLVLQIGDTAADFNQLTVSIDDMSAKGIGVDVINISSREGAQDAIDVIRAAIDQVSAQRATLGATQNRLEYTINNLDTASENIQAANSRIRDTDMAKMMMEYTKTNVITQSAQAMLAQANQQPQSILQLLQ